MMAEQIDPVEADVMTENQTATEVAENAAQGGGFPNSVATGSCSSRRNASPGVSAVRRCGMGHALEVRHW